MPEDDDGPRRKISHEIGQKLDELSLHDFDERIGLLRVEMERLEMAKTAKRKALDDAGSVFHRAPGT